MEPFAMMAIGIKRDCIFDDSSSFQGIESPINRRARCIDLVDNGRCRGWLTSKHFDNSLGVIVAEDIKQILRSDRFFSFRTTF